MSVNVTKTFNWNVLNNLQVTQLFEWEVGDGPLYWYKVEWKDTRENGCVCVPCAVAEFWYVLATSVEHLCTRLSTESCYRQNDKLIKSVQKYGRPALCCDNDSVEDDTYSDVDFCICACEVFVDMCDCPSLICSSSSATEMSFSLFQDGFKIEPLTVIQPLVGKTATSHGLMPNSLSLTHNIGKTNLLSAFLARNKVVLPSTLELTYNKLSDVWQKSLHLAGHGEDWHILLEWKSWQFNMLVRHNGKVTRLLIVFSAYGVDKFDVAFNYNTKTESVGVRHPIHAESKFLHDEIGLFEGSWTKDPFLKVQIKHV